MMDGQVLMLKWLVGSLDTLQQVHLPILIAMGLDLFG
jgi:hypothetical protein